MHTDKNATRRSWAQKAAIAAVLAILAAPAAAETYQVCDPEYMQTLQEKAWMESMRETQVNGMIIKKPDSVLAYSCFDKATRDMADGGGAIFSETDNTSLIDNALTQFAGGNDDYYTTNFAEPLAGGATTPTLNDANGEKSTGCDTMQKVWLMAHCAKFEKEYFLSFDELSDLAAGGMDPRSDDHFSCSTTTQSSDLGTLYTNAIARTSDLNKTRTDANNDASAAGLQVGIDYDYFSIARVNYCATDAKTGAALGDGKVCSTTNPSKEYKCSEMKAIPTGLVVSYTTTVGGQAAGTQMWNYRCLNPGCYFDPAANAGNILYQAGGSPPSNIMCSEKPY